MIMGAGHLAILGGGGHGRVVADCALAAGWTYVTFFDDGKAPGSRTGPWLISGNGDELAAKLGSFDGFVVAIGNNAARWASHQLLAGRGVTSPATVVHPAAVVSRHASLGHGSVIVAGVVINIGARIGAATIVNTGASVDHDAEVGDGAHISPGARLAGGVKVGDRSWIGAGAIIREGIAIGRDAIVGAGAIVVKPVPDDATVAGNPARIIVRSIS